MLKVAQRTLIYKPDAIWKISSIVHLIFSSHCLDSISLSLNVSVCVCFMYRLQKGQKVDGTNVCWNLSNVERHTRQIVVMTWIFRNGDRSMNITSAAEAASKLEKRERKNCFIAMKDKNLELLCASRFAWKWITNKAWKSSWFVLYTPIELLNKLAMAT